MAPFYLACQDGYVGYRRPTSDAAALLEYLKSVFLR